jgi:hypothetical protein
MAAPGLTSNTCESRGEHTSGKERQQAERDGLPDFVRISRWSRVYGALAFVPARCRYDPNRPFEFSIGLNLLFGIYIAPNLLLFKKGIVAYLFSSLFRLFSLCSMFHRRKFALQPTYPQSAGARLWRY